MATITPSSLANIPQEVLENIAYFSATETLLGPPSGITSLIATNRWTHSCLSALTNPSLYARIFENKFDLLPVLRRLGTDEVSAACLVQELQRRCLVLKRIRARVDCLKENEEDSNESTTHETLLLAYLMVIENEGKNERHLREYAQIDIWLKDFWFHEKGASGVRKCIQLDMWPKHNESTCLGMWLYWFLVKPEHYKKEEPSTWSALETLKLYALGAHRYPLVIPSWTYFAPRPQTRNAREITYYGSQVVFQAPALVAPAVLSYITLVSHLHEQSDYSTPFAPSEISSLSLKVPRVFGTTWEYEWGRSFSLGHDRRVSEVLRPGSLEGIWEGLFTYTEFTSYAALLSGAPPNLLQKSLVAQHKQTWKLREHHLLSSTTQHREIKVESGVNCPLSAGDPLRSYFPIGTRIQEHPTGLEVHEPGKPVIHYERPGLAHSHAGTEEEAEEDETAKPEVLDIIVVGEGHSAWGEFSLVGRVRPCDGFISFSKDYVNGDRGKWLYRGYLVGNAVGNIAGRWRDTLSPETESGYEGSFTMTRRR